MWLADRRRSARSAGLWEGRQCAMRRSWGGKRGGMMQGGGEVQAGPSGTATPACGARGGRPLFAPFARLCAPNEEKLQPCAWRHVAKVGPTEPASCMRCYISVLRLNRPQSATIYGFNCGLKPWAEPPIWQSQSRRRGRTNCRYSSCAGAALRSAVSRSPHSAQRGAERRSECLSGVRVIPKVRVV